MLELDIEEVSATLGISARHVSVDTPLSEGEDNTLLDVLENGRRVHGVMPQRLRGAAEVMGPRPSIWRKVIRPLLKS